MLPLVTYYNTFKADYRLSMEIYAQRLSDAMQSQFCGKAMDNELAIENFVPQSSSILPFNNRLTMRYLRYFSYPRQVQGRCSQIHHITDHGYAHLISKLGAGAKIISVHDVIPFLAWKGLIRGVDASVFRKPILNLYSLKYLSEFDHIITISQQTKSDLLEYFSVPESKLSVIPPIIDQRFCPQSADRVAQFKQRHELNNDRQYVLLPGSAFYKNLKGSLAALKDLCAKNPDLTILKTGVADVEFNRQVHEKRLSDRVSQIYLEDKSELPLLYSSVDCLLFPSFYEGFGMPVIEALACHCPVVTSNQGALAEIGGDWVYRVDPLDHAEISDKVSKALTRVAYTKQQHQSILGELSQYWEKPVAENMMNVYQRFDN